MCLSVHVHACVYVSLEGRGVCTRMFNHTVSVTYGILHIV